MINKLKPGWGIIPVTLFLVVWELVAQLNVVPGQLYFPAFSDVIRELVLLVANGVLAEHFFRSLVRVLIGFSTGSLVGLTIGVLIGWNQLLNKALSPLISLVYPIPALGWLPVLMLWMGINELLPIAIIFIGSFFPVCYNTATGVRSVGQTYVWAARSLGASEITILFTIILPLAIPKRNDPFRDCS